MTNFMLSPSKLVQAIERTLIAGLVPYVQGPPGVGKSDIFKQIANKWSLKTIDTRLSQCTPEDLNGLPFRNGDKAEFLPFSNFPIQGDTVPEGYDGWLIILDELSSATKAVQAAAYKLILDREVGIHKLHDKVMLVAAGNRMGDKAVVVSQSTALQSRLIHFEVKVSKKDWVKWALENNIDNRIIGYIEYKPSNLHAFDPNHNDKTFPCPRTWGFVSQFIKGKPRLDHIDVACMAGAISDGPAVEFQKFCEIANNVPSIETIMHDPEGTEVPREVSFRFFVTTALIDHSTDKTIETLFKYMNRLPEEFQVIYLRGLAIRNPKLRSHPIYAKNVTKLLRFLHDDDNAYAAT